MLARRTLFKQERQNARNKRLQVCMVLLAHTHLAHHDTLMPIDATAVPSLHLAHEDNRGYDRSGMLWPKEMEYPLAGHRFSFPFRHIPRWGFPDAQWLITRSSLACGARPSVLRHVGKGRIVGWSEVSKMSRQTQDLVDIQGVLEMLVDLHNRSLVSAAVAVVGCCKYWSAKYTSRSMNFFCQCVLT
jgi:hypothetical protein